MKAPGQFIEGTIVEVAKMDLKIAAAGTGCRNGLPVRMDDKGLPHPQTTAYQALVRLDIRMEIPRRQPRPRPRSSPTRNRSASDSIAISGRHSERRSGSFSRSFGSSESDHGINRIKPPDDRGFGQYAGESKLWTVDAVRHRAARPVLANA